MRLHQAAKWWQQGHLDDCDTSSFHQLLVVALPIRVRKIQCDQALHECDIGTEKPKLDVAAAPSTRDTNDVKQVI